MSGLPRGGVDRVVQGREQVLENPRDVALLHVGEGREVPVGERESVVVVAHVERLPEPLRESLDEAELALVGAATDRRRLELDAERLSLRALELVDDLLSVRQPSFDDQLVLGGEKLPVEKVREGAAIHRQELRPGDDTHLVADATRQNSTDANHESPGLREARPTRRGKGAHTRGTSPTDHRETRRVPISCKVRDTGTEDKQNSALRSRLLCQFLRCYKRVFGQRKDEGSGLGRNLRLVRRTRVNRRWCSDRRARSAPGC